MDMGMDRDMDGTESMDATDRMLDNARTWTADMDGDRSGAGSKRRLADTPRAPKVLRGKGYLRRGRPRTQPVGKDELDGLMTLYRDQRAIVGPMMDLCRGDGDKLALLRALRDFVADPNDRSACAGWLAMVQRFRPA